MFQAGREMLQVQPEVAEMVSGSCLNVFSSESGSPAPKQTGGSLVGLCRVFIAVVLVLFVVWLVLDTSKRPEQLISFGGICVFILLLFILSAHRTAVSFAAGVELLWGQLFRNTCGCYRHTLSVAAFTETWDITCPFAPVIFTLIIGPSRTASL